MDTVCQIKNQYARFLGERDWPYLKEIAEYYLRTAATLKAQDIRNAKKKLLLRNAQKRLYLGIGCELLLKLLYLRQGLCINRFKQSFVGKKAPIHRLADVSHIDIDHTDTFTMRQLIDHLPLKIGTEELRRIRNGLQIAMAFRNKEGHISFPVHEFSYINYRDIADAVKLVFREGFGESLEFRVSMKKKQKGWFRHPCVTTGR
jgi:hypothetical protein